MQEMKKALTMILLVLGMSAVATSCKTDAIDQELEKMCEHLLELRSNMNIETDVKKCIADAKKERVSQRQAQCRISAVNVSEYWNRCRTGEDQRQ